MLLGNIGSHVGHYRRAVKTSWVELLERALRFDYDGITVSPAVTPTPETASCHSAAGCGEREAGPK
jgi:hypothetical protein